MKEKQILAWTIEIHKEIRIDVFETRSFVVLKLIYLEYPN